MKENQVYSRDSYKKILATCDGSNAEFLCDLGGATGRQSRSVMESMS